MGQVTKKKEKWLLHSDRTDWRISSVIQREDAEHVDNHAFAMSERTGKQSKPPRCTKEVEVDFLLD